MLIGASAYHRAASGGGAMVLNNVQCRGNEATLLDCPKGILTICSSSELAGVNCLPRSGGLQ